MKRFIFISLLFVAPEIVAMDEEIPAVVTEQKAHCLPCENFKGSYVQKLYGCIACCYTVGLRETGSADECHKYICDFCLDDAEGHVMYDAGNKSHYLSYECFGCKRAVNVSRFAADNFKKK